jgi:hypothetical protein
VELGQELLLQDDVPGQPVEPVDEQPVGPVVDEQRRGRGQARPVGDVGGSPERPASV